MAEALRAVNSGDSVPTSLAKAADSVIVAFDESNPICVGKFNSADSDLVKYFDIASHPRPKPIIIAPNFLSFMLLAANAEEITLRQAVTPEQAEAEMRECCSHLCGPDVEQEFWMDAVYSAIG